MAHKQVFGRLVDNAFDFLEKAIGEFESDPKYSVIHFYSAVELFLKARLLLEHWTLVVSKPDAADLDRFLAGTFKSVTLIEARQRLASIVKDGLTKQEFECFQKLGGHRNQMMHFFHPGQHAKKTDREKIMSEQCQAWYFLHRLLSQQWKKPFNRHQRKIYEFDLKMRHYRTYLSAKFSFMRQTIEEKKAQGTKFTTCPSCGFLSLEETYVVDPIIGFKCYTCDLNTTGLHIECPNCHNHNLLIDDAWQSCSACESGFDDDIVKDWLTKDRILTKDDLDEIIEANCGYCDGYQTVVPLNDEFFFCVGCFELIHLSDISQCAHCGDHCSGHLEDSYLCGCPACDGRLGWESDKD